MVLVSRVRALVRGERSLWPVSRALVQIHNVVLEGAYRLLRVFTQRLLRWLEADRSAPARPATIDPLGLPVHAEICTVAPEPASPAELAQAVLGRLQSASAPRRRVEQARQILAELEQLITLLRAASAPEHRLAGLQQLYHQLQRIADPDASSGEFEVGMVWLLAQREIGSLLEARPA